MNLKVQTLSDVFIGPLVFTSMSVGLLGLLNRVPKILTPVGRSSNS